MPHVRGVGVALLLWWATGALGARELTFTCNRGRDDERVPCTVTLVPHVFTSPLIITKSGVPLEVPLGIYDVRAGAPGLAVRDTLTLQLDQPTADPHRVVLTLGVGGRIRLAPDLVPPGGAAQVLSLPTGRVDTLLVDRDKDLPFPAGDVVVTALSGPDQFLGMTEPFGLAAGAEKEVERVHHPAKGTSDLIVKFDYEVSTNPGDAQVMLHGTKRDVAARAASDSRTHYSFFYGVPWGTYEIQLASKYWWAKKRTITLEKNSPLIDEDLQISRKPSLTLAPVEEDSGRTFAYSVYDCDQSLFGPFTGARPDKDKCRVVREGKTGGTVVVRNLDPTWYFVTMSRGHADLAEQVDMRDGKDQRLTPRFRDTVVSGHVRRSGEGLAAEILVESEEARETIESLPTDPGGAYEVLLPEHQVFRFTVRPLSDPDETAPIFQLATSGVSMERDFDLPSTKPLIVVLEKGSEAPIARATVAFTQAGSSEERVTNDLGEVSLPALPEGRHKIQVSAEGFKPEVVEVALEVRQQDGAQRIPIHLKGQHLSLRIRLPNGTAPERSAAFLLAAGASAVLEKEPCDDSGMCNFAEDPPPSGLLIGAGVGGGLTVASAASAFERGEVTLQPEGGVLRVAVTRGAESRRSLLYLIVSVDGIVVPESVIASTANLLLKGYRLFLQADNPQVLEVPGLPAGEVSVTLVPIDESKRQTGRETSARVSLPRSNPVGLSLP
jgi:hypothetical protein